MAENKHSKYTYYAFISYKREDEKWAKWLQKKLESYGFPVALRKDNPSLPSKIRPIFRDQSELSGGNLKEEIEKGLEGSKYLIVICSPRSAQSPWVSKEVQYFIDNDRENYIIPFIIGGSPNAKNPEEECFPEGLRKLSGEKEILGININEMGRDAATIKVIARMFGLRFDTLWQRHERAKRRKRFAVIAGVAAFAITGFILAAIMNSLRNEADEQRKEAQKQTHIAQQESQRANRERDNALRANKSLEIANDSIKRQSTLIVQANENLAESNRRLAESNWKMLENYARSVAAKAITEIDKGNVIESILALLSVTPNNNEKPYVSEVEQALRLAYDKYASTGWIYTELDGFYDFIYLSPDEKYLICEGNDYIDIVNAHSNQIYTQIKRKNIENEEAFEPFGWGSLSSKDGSKLYIIDGGEIRLFDIQSKMFFPCESDLSRCTFDIHFPFGHSRFNKRFNFTDRNEIISISPDFKFYITEKESLPDTDDNHYLYALKDFSGNTILSLDRNYRQELFNGLNYNALTGASFSPNGEMLALSFMDGHNELRKINDVNNFKIWSCGDDCRHYSNNNFFVNNDRILHTSAFEDKIKIFDVNSLNVVDSLNYILSIEASFGSMNKENNKLWIRELNTPVLYQKPCPTLIKTEGMKPLDTSLIEKIQIGNKMISLKNETIECTDNKGKVLWTYSSTWGSGLLGTFDNDRLLIIENYMPRGGDYRLLIEANSGKEVYRDFGYNCLIDEYNTRLVEQNSYNEYNRDHHEILGYHALIKACKEIVSQKVITKKGHTLFNLLD